MEQLREIHTQTEYTSSTAAETRNTQRDHHARIEVGIEMAVE
jgi:hypothetical protein